MNNRRRKCRGCEEWYLPQPHNAYHQRYCTAPACRKKSKRASQRKWLRKNPGQHSGRANVFRVQTWREQTPGLLANRPAGTSPPARPVPPTNPIEVARPPARGAPENGRVTRVVPALPGAMAAGCVHPGHRVTRVDRRMLRKPVRFPPSDRQVAPPQGEGRNSCPGKERPGNRAQGLVESPVHLIERAASFYEKTLQDDGTALDWLRNRGLDDPDLIEPHRIGYCDGSLSGILPRDRDARAALQDAGILADPDTERLRGCTVFPLCDPEGGVVGLWGSEAKSGNALCLPDSPTALWNSRALTLYPEVYLAGNPLDGLSLIKAGCMNTVALVGPACPYRIAPLCAGRACGRSPSWTRISTWTGSRPSSRNCTLSPDTFLRSPTRS